MDRTVTLKDSRLTTRRQAIVDGIGIGVGILDLASKASLPSINIGGSTFNVEGDNGSGGSGLAIARLGLRSIVPGARVASAAVLNERRSCNDNGNANDNLVDGCVLTATLQARAFWIDRSKKLGEQVTTGLGGRIMMVTHGADAWLFRTAEQDRTDGTGFVIAGPVNINDEEAMKEAIKKALKARPVSGTTEVAITASPETRGRFYNDSARAWESDVPLINLGFKRASSESGQVTWTDPEIQHGRLCIAGETVRSLLYQVRSIDGVYPGHNGVNPNRPYIENHKVYSN